MICGPGTFFLRDAPSHAFLFYIAFSSSFVFNNSLSLVFILIFNNILGINVEPGAKTWKLKRKASEIFFFPLESASGLGKK